MTDRELLEYAAKAAGIDSLSWTEPDGTKIVTNVRWNPLESDGDAFRLAVKLGIDVLQTNIHSPQVHALAATGVQVWEDSGNDPLDATRRAIVRAAAEIGRGMV